MSKNMLAILSKKKLQTNIRLFLRKNSILGIKKLVKEGMKSLLNSSQDSFVLPAREPEHLVIFRSSETPTKLSYKTWEINFSGSSWYSASKNCSMNEVNAHRWGQELKTFEKKTGFSSFPTFHICWLLINTTKTR